MANKVEYKAISRIVENNEVIGFMVKEIGRNKNIYMSLDTISFGLKNKNFIIKDVKIGQNGKPRGYNGFLLSKLPIQNLVDDTEVKKGLLTVLKYLMTVMDIEKDSVSRCENIKNGVLYESSIFVTGLEYNDLGKENGTAELKKSLHFYIKHMEKELKEKFDTLEGYVDDKYTVIKVVKSRVMEDSTL